MHGPINVKSPNNISEWQMGFNSAFKGLKTGNKSFERVKQFRYLGKRLRIKILFRKKLKSD